MGWTPVNKLTLVRDFETRKIVITWRDEVTGEHEKRFGFDQKQEAADFAAKEFNQLEM